MSPLFGITIPTSNMRKLRFTCPDSQSQEELQLGLKLKFTQWQSLKSPPLSFVEYHLELRSLCSFSHSLSSFAGKRPSVREERLECVCTYTRVCAHTVSMQQLALVAFTQSPVLQPGISMQGSILPVTKTQCEGQKEALASAKTVILRHVSEANSCFRSLLTSTCCLSLSGKHSPGCKLL